MPYNDRMLFIFFISALVHVGLMFGVVFSAGDLRAVQQSLEVTLANYTSSEAPDEADFLAQANQVGSGTLEEKAVLSTNELADFSDNVIRQVTPQNSPPQKQVQQHQLDVITSSRSKDQQPLEDHLVEENQQDPVSDLQREILEKSLEIASLEAILREKRQAHAKRPRKRQLTAASTKASRDAEYLDAWRSKIETLGNLNYPKLNIQELYGELQLLVAVRHDGTIQQLKVLRSSGYQRLDDAAIKVVRDAAPFDPFPDTIRVDTDILEIIRTWRFEKGSYISTF